jgi:hypothetical protein
MVDRRLRAVVLSVLVAGCSTSVLPTTSLAPGSPPASTAVPGPTDESFAPIATPEPFALVAIEQTGGECATGMCTRLVNIEGDGTLHEVIPKDVVLGVVPEELRDALRVEIERADYRQIASRPFTGTCPTAYDGQQVTYTFHPSTGDRTIDSCKVAIDPSHPLFRALDAALKAAGG